MLIIPLPLTKADLGVAYRIQGVGYRVEGVGCRVEGRGCRIQGLEFGDAGKSIALGQG